MRALGAHIYAGGFAVGVSQHFEILGHLEESPYGVRSFKLNFPHVPTVTQHDRWRPFIDDLKRDYGHVEFMYANPPCAVWSVAGANMRHGRDAWRTDPRLHCWTRCFDAFEQLRPDVYACESVVRAFTAGNEFMQELADRAEKLGYGVTFLLVDAQYLNTPQKRKRYFFLAHRFEIPWPRLNWAPPETVSEALSRVKKPGNILPITDPLHAELIAKLPPRTPLRKVWEDRVPESERVMTQYGVKGRPRMFVHRVHGDKPMGTITGNYFLHPTENRYLGIRELLVLNGFPEDYQLEGGERNWHGHGSLIARGVCPPVAEWVARCARDAIERGVLSITSRRVVDLREPGLALAS